MVLTQSDLQKIGEVIDEKLEEKFDKKLKPITKELKYIRKTVDIIVKDYDERDVKLSKRVDRIELHLALPKEN